MGGEATRDEGAAVISDKGEGVGGYLEGRIDGRDRESAEQKGQNGRENADVENQRLKTAARGTGFLYLMTGAAGGDDDTAYWGAKPEGAKLTGSGNPRFTPAMKFSRTSKTFTSCSLLVITYYHQGCVDQHYEQSSPSDLLLEATDPDVSRAPRTQ